MVRLALLAMMAASIMLAGLLPPELVRDRLGVRFTAFCLAGRADSRARSVAWPQPGVPAEGAELYPQTLPSTGDCNVEIPVEGLFAIGILCLGSISSACLRNPELRTLRDLLRLALAMPTVELSAGGSGFWGGSALMIFLGVWTLGMAGRMVWFLADPKARPPTIHLRIDRRGARG